MSGASPVSMIQRAIRSNCGSLPANRQVTPRKEIRRSISLRDSAVRDWYRSGPTPSGPATGGVVMHKVIPLTVALVAALGVSGCTKGAKAAADPAQIEQSIRAQESQWQKDYASKDVN